MGPGRCEEYRLQAQRFDLIFSNTVLHHLEDAHPFWSEIHRLSKPGGFVYVRDLQRPADEETARQLVAQHAGHLAEVVRVHYLSSLRSSYSCAEVQEQLARAGLACLGTRPYQDRFLEVFGRVS